MCLTVVIKNGNFHDGNFSKLNSTILTIHNTQLQEEFFGGFPLIIIQNFNRHLGKKLK